MGRISVLITGGSGFIGANLVEYMVKLDVVEVVVNLDCNPPPPNAPRNCIFESVDLAEGVAAILAVLKKYQFTHIIHLAALSHVDDSYAQPIEYVKSNVLGSANLLEAIRVYNKSAESRLAKVIYTSTDEVYGDPDVASHEESSLHPSNPYAATKAGGDMLAQAYRHSFSLPLVIIRPNNIYGPGQDLSKVVPKFIDLARRGEPLTIAGDGSQTRNFLHVDDLIQAIVILMNAALDHSRTFIYNINSNHEISILNLAKLIWVVCHGMDSKPKITFIEDRPYNDKHYYISANPIRKLGWKQTTSIVVALPKLIFQSS